MNIKFNGVVSGVQSGDAITKIEVALAVNGETADQAVTAGRVVTITNSTEIANFQSTGTVVADTPVVQSRRVGWHTLSIDVQASNITTKVGDVILYTSNIPTMTRTVNRIRLSCSTQNADPTIKTAYFKNLKRNGELVDDLSGTLIEGAAVAPNWVNGLGPSQGTQVFSAVAPDGSTCLKFIAGDGVITNGSVQWHRYVSLEAGTWTVEVWDAGEDKTGLVLSVYDNAGTPLSASCGISTSTVGVGGFYASGSGLTTTYFGFLSSCIPSVRVTESRGGTGAYVGGWTPGAHLILIGIGAPTPLSPTGASSSVSLVWSAPTLGTAPTGYYIYRALAATPTILTYLGYTTTTTYTNSAANGNAPVNGTAYVYAVASTDLYQEILKFTGSVTPA